MPENGGGAPAGPPAGGSVWVIVVAAGAGSRFGAAKQYVAVGGRRTVDRAVDAARSVADGVVLVVPVGTPRVDLPAVDVVVDGGATRSASVRAGLAAVPDGVDVVVVHDGARPLAGAALFEAVVDRVRRGADAALPGLPVTDTVKRVDGGVVVETLDRRALVAVQTPQAFRADVLRRAHAEGAEGTDDAALAEAVGAKVAVVPGDPRNVKLTHPVDLVVAEALERGERA